MKYATAILCFLTITAELFANPIDALEQRLNSSHGLWINGMTVAVNLPSNATPSEVLVAATTRFYEPIQTKTILSTQTMVIDGIDYPALLIESDQGQRIFIMKYEGDKLGWWNRFYDVRNENRVEQSGPAYPPQGVGSADP